MCYLKNVLFQQIPGAEAPFLKLKPNNISRLLFQYGNRPVQSQPLASGQPVPDLCRQSTAMAS